MRINSNHYNSYNSYPNFCGRIDKIINTLFSTKYAKELKITTDDAIKIYQKLGYIVRKKSGSHMTVTHPEGLVEFSLKIPHGSEKRFITPEAVKTLQCAVFEDIPQLKQSLHYHRL